MWRGAARPGPNPIHLLGGTTVGGGSCDRVTLDPEVIMMGGGGYSSALGAHLASTPRSLTHSKSTLRNDGRRAMGVEIRTVRSHVHTVTVRHVIIYRSATWGT